MAREKPRDYFLYKTRPFRVLYLGGVFAIPHKRDRLWLLRDRELARRLSALNGAEYADFRDYIRIAGGASPAQRGREPSTAQPPTLDDLA